MEKENEGGRGWWERSGVWEKRMEGEGGSEERREKETKEGRKERKK